MEQVLSYQNSTTVSTMTTLCKYVTLFYTKTSFNISTKMMLHGSPFRSNSGTV